MPFVEISALLGVFDVEHLPIGNTKREHRKRLFEQVATFAQRLNSAIERSGRRQSDIALAARMSPTAISYYTNGHRVPGALEFMRLAEVLGVDPRWLIGLGGDDEASVPVRGKPSAADAEHHQRSQLEINKWKQRALDAEAEALAAQAELARIRAESARAATKINPAGQIAMTDSEDPHPGGAKPGDILHSAHQLRPPKGELTASPADEGLVRERAIFGGALAVEKLRQEDWEADQAKRKAASTSGKKVGQAAKPAPPTFRES